MFLLWTKFSSQWVIESEKHGPYPTTDGFNGIEWMRDSGQMPIKHNEYNPYVEAFLEVVV